MPGWTSRDDREAVRLDGRAVLGDGREIDVRVTDLSRNGCRVESGETLRTGERIRHSAAPLDNA